MSHQDALNQAQPGRPLEVDIASIEDQLQELWKEVAETMPADDESAGAVARACVMNLVVYSEQPPQEAALTQSLTELSLQNPCRALLVMAEPEAKESRISAWISASCQRPTPGSKVVCCEQISFRGSGAAVRELATTAVPFLTSDLPVFLWWKGHRLFDSDFLRNFSPLCDRLILDSKHFASPRAEFPRLQNLIQSSWDRLAVSDVAWHRLMQWRELTAQFFDAAVFRTHLPHIEKVTVEFNERAEDGGGVPPQAYLLVGWFASRLKWELVSSETTGATEEFKLRSREGKGISVSIRPTEARAELSGHLVSFEIATGEEWATTFRIAKGENADCAQTEMAFSNLPPYRRIVPLRIYNETELIARQLEIVGHDPVYEESIAMAARLVGSLK